MSVMNLDPPDHLVLPAIKEGFGIEKNKDTIGIIPRQKKKVLQKVFHRPSLPVMLSFFSQSIFWWRVVISAVAVGQICSIKINLTSRFEPSAYRNNLKSLLRLKLTTSLLFFQFEFKPRQVWIDTFNMFLLIGFRQVSFTMTNQTVQNQIVQKKMDLSGAGHSLVGAGVDILAVGGVLHQR